MSLFTVIPQGRFESKCRKQLSLSSCGWVFDPFRPVQNHRYNFGVQIKGFSDLFLAVSTCCCSRLLKSMVVFLQHRDTEKCPLDASVTLWSHGELGSSACRSIFVKPSLLDKTSATRGLSRTADKSSERNALFNYFVRSRISEQQCCREILLVAKRAVHLAGNGPRLTRSIRRRWPLHSGPHEKSLQIYLRFSFHFGRRWM